MQDLADGNESACSALIVIGQESGLSVDRLSKILRLSQPGTVRLVDRLAEAKLVERKTGSDRRSRRAAPDRRRQAPGQIAAGRPPACLVQALRGLDNWERSTLSAIASKVLRGLEHSARRHATAAAACATTAPARTRTCPMMCV